MTRRACGTATGETRTRRPIRRAAPLALLVLLAAAGCGSSDWSEIWPPPTATPASTPTVLPSATPRAPLEIEPMLLAVPGLDAPTIATGVSPREWISVRSDGGFAVVLPPDAGPDAGPLPVPGCSLGEASPACARAGATIRLVGDGDWTTGSLAIDSPTVLESLPAAFGPAGEVELLVPCCAGPTGVALDVRPVPGARFLGSRDVRVATGLPVRRPVLWRAPGVAYEDLPIGDFADGVFAFDADDELRIAGTSDDPFLPLLWLPRDGGFDLVTLPLLDGTTIGGALGIDDGVVAGWSSFAEGPVAVVWRFDGDQWRAQRLPQPDGATSCQADAIDLPRIAGRCAGPGLRDGVGMVWRSDDLERWDIEASLLRGGYTHLSVTGLRGDLVVGFLDREGSFTESPAVAWRLPPD